MSQGAADPKVKATLDEHFDKIAQTYEKDGGGVQNSICRDLLSIANTLSHPVTKSSTVLDNASGPGILTGELLKQIPSDQVPELHAADFSAAMIRVLDAKGWTEKYGVKSAVMDAQALRYPDCMFTHIFMNLGIFALPDPVKGASEIYRTLKPGGIALVTTIRVAGWVVPFERARKRAKPDAPQFDGPLPATWLQSEWNKDILEKGGFEPDKVHIREASAEMSMVDFAGSQESIAKMARDMIVKDWTDDETAVFDEALKEELEMEENSGIPRSIDVWVGVAIK